MNKIKVVQFGTGKMAVYTMRYALEKGCEIVGAIDINPNIIGKDIGEIMNIEQQGVTITALDNAKEMLINTNPNICIITTMSLINDVYEALKLCASLGINAITTCEEAFFPSNSNPTITKDLNDLAVKNNCTLSGSGYQDIFWGQLISSIAGATHKITKIKGSSSYNVEEYGIALANAHGAGLSIEDFEEKIASVDNISDEERQRLINNKMFLPSYMWNVNGWLAKKLGLTITNQNQRCVPQIADDDIYSSTLNITIDKGKVTGMSAIVTSTTKEGITIESECIGKVYSKEDFDKNEWTIYGEPNTTIKVERPNTVELTCASIVNRIPDIINAPSGYITTNKMGELNYRSETLDHYIIKKD